jgi:hypothetical protein
MEDCLRRWGTDGGVGTLAGAVGWRFGSRRRKGLGPVWVEALDAVKDDDGVFGVEVMARLRSSRSVTLHVGLCPTRQGRACQRHLPSRPSTMGVQMRRVLDALQQQRSRPRQRLLSVRGLDSHLLRSRQRGRVQRGNGPGHDLSISLYPRRTLQRVGLRSRIL